MCVCMKLQSEVDSSTRDILGSLSALSLSDLRPEKDVPALAITHMDVCEQTAPKMDGVGGDW